jgi:hypothetical protein
VAWIKLRTDLLNDPAVYKLAGLLKVDRFAVVGRLAAFWGWADQHAVDGVVDGATSQVVDDVVALPGFADALVVVKWLRIEEDLVAIPNHDRHNGANAKERSLKSERQSKWRKGKADQGDTGGVHVDTGSGDPVDGDVDGDASTRGEKRRGEKKKPPKAPQGAVEVPEWIPAEPWEEFVAMRRAKGQRTPFTVGAAKGVIAKLDTFRASGVDLAAVLRQSTVNGWADVYELKPQKAGSVPPQQLEGAL